MEFLFYFHCFRVRGATTRLLKEYKIPLSKQAKKRAETNDNSTAYVHRCL